MKDLNDVSTVDLCGRHVLVVRMSTGERAGGQKPEAQLQAMKNRGWSISDGFEVHESRVSGYVPWADRGLGVLVRGLKSGDHLYGSEIRSFGRDAHDLGGFIRHCQNVGVVVHIAALPDSVCEGGAVNDFVLNMMLAAAQLEGQLTRERTKNHIDSLPKDANGKCIGWGRPKGSGNKKGAKGADKLPQIRKMLAVGMTKVEVARACGVSRNHLEKLLMIGGAK